jgi:small subunit ribosomal protein S8
MSNSDPIAELLTRIRNAAHARHNGLEIAHSRLREAICRVLIAEGFLDNAEVTGEGVKKKLALKLRYSATNEPVLRGIERVSKPSVRRYRAAAQLGRAHTRGMGVEVVTTPLGVMTGREARRQKVGGELLLRVW